MATTDINTKKCYCGNYKLIKSICPNSFAKCMNCCQLIGKENTYYSCRATQCQFKQFNGFNFHLCSECHSCYPSMNKSSQFIFYALSTMS